MRRLVPPSAQELYLTLPEGRVRILVGGGGARTPALLIHGANDAAGMSWYHTFAWLGRDRRVIAVDLPGFGGTTDVAPAGGPKEIADFVAKVADRLSMKRIIVFGTSMGGDVALNVALRHPDLTAALVLVGPGGLAERVGGRITQFFAWLGAQLPDPVLLPLAWLANRFSGTVLKAIVIDPSSLPRPVVEEFDREARAPRAGMAYARYNRATLGPGQMRNNLLSRVHEITAPALFFHGDSDPIVTPEGSRRAALLMADARLVSATGSGHWAQLENPGLFEREVTDFLATADPAPAS